MKSTTIHDVALEAGVSISTVSRVIREYPYIGEKTKNRVQEAIQALNYEPNTVARRLKYGRTNTIGFILPDISNPFFSNAIKAAYNLIQSSNYSDYELLFYNTDGKPERERKALDFFVARQMEGIIIASSASKAIIEHIRRILETKNITIVAIDNQLDDLKIDLVTADNQEGGYQLTTHLLGLGHRSIAVITGPASESSSRERLEGYRRALAERGIPYQASLVYEGDWTRDSGVGAINRIIASPPKPTAIFGFNNSMSMGALSVLKACGLRVPEDMALVSFEDVEYGDLVQPGLTCTNTSWYELGRASAQLLLDRFSNGNSAPRQSIRLPFDVIIRGSCGYTLSANHST